jgi:hypothetical protein
MVKIGIQISISIRADPSKALALLRNLIDQGAGFYWWICLGQLWSTGVQNGYWAESIVGAIRCYKPTNGTGACSKANEHEGQLGYSSSALHGTISKDIAG